MSERKQTLAEVTAVEAAEWAAGAMSETLAVARTLGDVGRYVARDIASDKPKPFLLARRNIDDAWEQATKALQTIARAQEMIRRATEDPTS